jgi:hypothetical protein
VPTLGACAPSATVSDALQTNPGNGFEPQSPGSAKQRLAPTEPVTHCRSGRIPSSVGLEALRIFTRDHPVVALEHLAELWASETLRNL